MRVSIFSPKRIIWQGAVRDITLPTEDGEICVLDFHQPFLVRLAKGDIRLGTMIRESANINKIFVKDGLARMHGNELVILTET